MRNANKAGDCTLRLFRQLSRYVGLGEVENCLAFGLRTFGDGERSAIGTQVTLVVAPLGNLIVIAL